MNNIQVKVFQFKIINGQIHIIQNQIILVPNNVLINIGKVKTVDCICLQIVDRGIRREIKSFRQHLISSFQQYVAFVKFSSTHVSSNSRGSKEIRSFFKSNFSIDFPSTITLPIV